MFQKSLENRVMASSRMYVYNPRSVRMIASGHAVNPAIESREVGTHFFWGHSFLTTPWQCDQSGEIFVLTSMYKTIFTKRPARQGVASWALRPIEDPCHSPPLSPAYHNMNIHMMHPYHRSHFDSGYGCSPLWLNCVGCPDTRFKRYNTHHIFSVRHSYWCLPRK